MSILVVGATGFVGKQVALKLQARSGGVHALVRGGENNPKAADLTRAGIRIVDADLTQPHTLGPACRGIETVISTATSMPVAAADGLRTVDLEGTLALIDAAEGAGVKKFVYTSYSGNLRNPSPLEIAKRSCEQRLLNSRMEAVILRPSYFMEMWLSPVLGFDPAQGTARIYGSGEAKGSYVSAFNVADFAVATATRMTEPQLVLEIGGPEPLSQLDAVRIFERALNKEFRLEYVPIEIIRQQHSSDDPLQKTFGALMLGYGEGDVVPGAHVTAQQYGINLRSVAGYAAGFQAQAARTA